MLDNVKKLPALIMFSLLAFLLCCPACGIVRPSAKSAFTDGFYRQRLNGKARMVYVDVVEDVLRIHPTRQSHGQTLIDPALEVQTYQSEAEANYDLSTSFNKTSFDIDLLAIPLKLRPAQADVPIQLNASIQSALYVGIRQDKYHVLYIPMPLGHSSRIITHWGFSVGGFSGFGNTFMSPTNTAGILQQEYDGVVWSNGLAGIFAVNNFTAGVSLGFDYLLDSNRSIWIYQRKPWLGLALGLNLN